MVRYCRARFELTVFEAQIDGFHTKLHCRSATAIAWQVLIRAPHKIARRHHLILTPPMSHINQELVTCPVVCAIYYFEQALGSCCQSSYRPGLREIGTIEEQFGLEGLTAKTRMLLRWIDGGRKANIRKRKADGADERERLEIRGYQGISATYPNSMIALKEIIRCCPGYKYGGDNDWVKVRNDTVLIRFAEGEGSHSMANRRARGTSRSWNVQG